ncbi:uncharacterized protein LOC131548954 isoform X6 [Onychostoma macrolepis]|uniref:uncharacterized protein LOC131548954 isoform X6 n=1 Tax=Onychostoma macrolepis TaxID=369639 RepID=UPI00272B8DF5|nr:uncharacterized protein LOC131548954 isoform X6 [Onychostoma macrolepis]
MLDVGRTLRCVFISTEAVLGEEVKNVVGVVGGTVSFHPTKRFKDITTLDEKIGQITITNLKVEHSGEYTIDINSKQQGQRFSLEVMERVPKPKITVEESSNPDVVYLICEYSGTIIWKNSAGETLEGNKNHKPGEFITVKNTRNPENYYTCTLENAVSEETSEPVYERDLFKE